MRPEVRHAQSTSGSWPHAIDIVREIRISEDLARLESRRVIAIRIYTNNDPVVSLSVADARTLLVALGKAIDQAEQGPLGDLGGSGGES
jgi:hypothetical protein